MEKRTSLIVALTAMLVGYSHAVYADTAAGRVARDAGKYGVAGPKFEAAISRGNYDGRYWITRHYELGYGAPCDLERAFSMMKEAAKHGVVVGERRLAEIYRRGIGGLQNYPQARTWFNAAATDGDVIAQRELGELYAGPTDIPADAIRAYAWLDVAARSGDQPAIHRRAKLAKSMKPGDIKVANELAHNFAATIAVWSRLSDETK